MKADTACYCMSKRVTKEALQESLHAQITRARLTAYEVDVFSREISKLPKIRPSPSFTSH